MKSIAIVTDSNTGMSMKKAEALGIYQIPMPAILDGVEYLEGVNMTQEDFFARLREEPDVKISTTQPAPGTVIGLWEKLLKEHDEIVHIPMSSGLSNSCETARMLAEDFNGRVRVVDNQRISGGMRYAAIEAKQLAKKGLGAAEIGDWLEKTKFDASVYISLSTLKWLKKNGRLTPAAAAIGTLLRIRPVLQIQGYKLDTYAKARTLQQAKTILCKALRNDMGTRFGQNVNLNIIHSDFYDEALQFEEEVRREFPQIREINIDPLSLSVSCHIGPGSLAFTIEKKHPEIWD